MFYCRGTVVEQGAVVERPGGGSAKNCHIRSGCYVRENVDRRQRRCDGKLLRIQKFHPVR